MENCTHEKIEGEEEDLINQEKKLISEIKYLQDIINGKEPLDELENTDSEEVDNNFTNDPIIDENEISKFRKYLQTVDHELYKMLGMCCRYISKQQFVFNFSYPDDTFSIQILIKDKKFHLGKWCMPLSINSNDLVKTFDNFEDVLLFVKKCKEQMNSYIVRQTEYKKLKEIISDIRTIRCDTNLSYTLISLEFFGVFDLQKGNKLNISVNLCYQSNEAKPARIKIESIGSTTLEDDVHKKLKTIMKQFKTVELSAAFKKIELITQHFLWYSSDSAVSSDSDISDLDEFQNFVAKLHKGKKKADKSVNLTKSQNNEETQIYSEEEREEISQEKEEVITKVAKPTKKKLPSIEGKKRNYEVTIEKTSKIPKLKQTKLRVDEFQNFAEKLQKGKETTDKSINLIKSQNNQEIQNHSEKERGKIRKEDDINTRQTKFTKKQLPSIKGKNRNDEVMNEVTSENPKLKQTKVILRRIDAVKKTHVVTSTPIHNTSDLQNFTLPSSIENTEEILRKDEKDIIQIKLSKVKNTIHSGGKEKEIRKEEVDTGQAKPTKKKLPSIKGKNKNYRILNEETSEIPKLKQTEVILRRIDTVQKTDVTSTPFNNTSDLQNLTDPSSIDNTEETLRKDKKKIIQIKLSKIENTINSGEKKREIREEVDIRPAVSTKKKLPSLSEKKKNYEDLDEIQNFVAKLQKGGKEAHKSVNLTKSQNNEETQIHSEEERKEIGKEEDVNTKVAKLTKKKLQPMKGKKRNYEVMDEKTSKIPKLKQTKLVLRRIDAVKKTHIVTSTPIHNTSNLQNLTLSSSIENTEEILRKDKKEIIQTKSSKIKNSRKKK